MRPIRYILDDDHRPLALDDDLDDEHLLIWARWLEEPTRRIVEQTDVGPYWVSTVFLGIDHNFSPDAAAPPILFETMVFARRDLTDGVIVRRGDDFDCRRYATWDEAVAGHALTVQLVQLSLAPAPAPTETPKA